MQDANMMSECPEVSQSITSIDGCLTLIIFK
jgi:hypothetical protein